MAVLLSRFPLITETFILREVIEMERQGQPVRLVPLLQERPRVVHREALPWMERALHAPLLSMAVLVASLRALRRRPGRVLRLFGRLLAASAADPNFLLRTLALFPKSLWLAERLEAEGAAHLHAHFATHPATTAMIVSSLTGIPWSVTVHAHDIFVRQAMLRDKLAAARFVRAISRFNREYLERRFPGEVEAKVRVIHLGIDPGGYRGLPLPASDPPKILCVASLRPYKGVPVLLEACRRLVDDGTAFHCEIAGEGPMRPELESRIAGLGLCGRVSLLGALPQHEVTRRLGESAVFVLPSVVAPDGQMEGIPVALMEAMAAGRPVVASALSGIPELVEDGVSGFLVQPGDAPGIAAALKRLLADPDLRLRLGERGREKVEAEFRLDGTVAGLAALIDRHALPAEPEVSDLLRRAGLGGAGVRRVHRRMDSMVVEALAAGPRELILKIQRSRSGESRPPLERARHEFAVLSSLQQRFAGEPGFGVPRPLRLAEDIAAVVMERCRGTALDGIVRRGRTARGAEWEEMISAVRNTGRWLRLFQERTRKAGDGGPALAALRERAAADLAACRRRRLLPAALARRVEERLRQLSGEISLASPAGSHGDFWPGNIYADRDGGVQVIDFEGCREGLLWEDPAYFLVELELFFAWPGLGGRGERAKAAFLEGWSGSSLSQGVEDEQALDLCRIAKALQILSLAGEPGSSTGWRAWKWRRALVAILRRAGAER